MPPSAISFNVTRLQKVCTLWTHDENLSRDEVVFNNERFPELSLSAGSLVMIVAARETSAVRDFQDIVRTTSSDTLHRIKADAPRRPSVAAFSTSKRSRRNSVTVTLDENGAPIHGGRDVDPEMSYVFVCKPMAAELRSRYPNLHVSISRHIAKAIGFRDRMSVVVAVADEETHSASHVEITFRDEYLARSDMWRLATSELSQRTVYKGQNLLFLNTIKAQIKNIFVGGQTKHSAYFATSTKPIFRSESSRYVVFIQMSKEMWDFDTEGTGEIMFNKVINGFLPELFKRWMRINARHLVSIILFTRVEYDDEDAPLEIGPDGQSEKVRHRDFYRVVVSEMSNSDWIRILYQLKKEFRTFLRDVSLVPKAESVVNGARHPGVKIAGTPTTASKGNILEAINLAVAQFSQDYVDRDLVRTGISVIVITPGTGVHEVNYSMLKLTTETLLGSGIGIDLVCLSPMPLHSVPLFMYRSPRLKSSIKRIAFPRSRRPSKDFELEPIDDSTPKGNLDMFNRFSSSLKSTLGNDTQNGNLTGQPDSKSSQWRYAMPHWLDVSFWSGPSDEVIELSRQSFIKKSSSKTRRRTQTFDLRCRMYELQMMGIMENELSNISVPFLHDDKPYPWHLRRYNENLVLTQYGIRTQLPVEDVTSEHDRKSRNSTITLRPLGDKERQYGQYLNQKWMNFYDDQVFEAPTVRRPSTSLTRQYFESPEQRQRRRSSLNDSILSTSAHNLGSSLALSARPSPSMNLHQIMHDRSSSRRRSNVRDVLYPDRSNARDQARVMYDSWSEASPPQTKRALSRGPSGRKEVSISKNHPESTMAFDSWLSSHDTIGASSGSPIKESRSTSQQAPSDVRSKKADVNKSKTPSTTSNPRPPSLLSRHISFGGKGFVAAPQVSMSAAVLSSETSNLASLTRESLDRSSLSAKAVASDLQSSRTSLTSESSAALQRMSSLLQKPLEPVSPIAKLNEIQGTTGERPTAPITIKSSLHGGQDWTKSSGADHNKGSIGGYTDLSDSTKVGTSQRSSEIKDPGSLFLVAGSRNQEPKVNLSTSGGGGTIPNTLSPTSALSPWLVLVNPCNPKKNNLDVSGQFRRWQHVFPRPLRASDIKWKSLSSPASVPLTNEYFPTGEQLANEYHESPYKVIHDEDDDFAEKLKEPLIKELISFRLSRGFQIVIGPTVAEVSGSQELKLSSIFNDKYMTQDGDSIFMCVGSTIHQLVCVSGGEVEIKRFTRKPLTALEHISPGRYKPFIRTQLEDKYEERNIAFTQPKEEYNWNLIDSFLAGYQDDFSDQLRFWRARFVLIPIDLPAHNRRPPSNEDYDEEVRLDGIRKLTQLWQKYRWVPPEERLPHQLSARKSKDPNPLAIEYQTRDPSVVVAAGLEHKLLSEGEALPFTTQLFSKNEQYYSDKIDLVKLAQDLQGDHGISIHNRRWHFRLHFHCFVGSDFTSWLLHRFTDIEYRDDAVELGNKLMQKGLFQHVKKVHEFKDGQYFYQIASEYRAPRPESKMGWFGTRRSDKSVPSTPLSDNASRPSPLSTRARSARPDSSSSSSSSQSGDGEKTPRGATTPRRQVLLSRSLRHDVGARRKCYRPEIINLHYDRLHNPANCYHIRIEWMNVTSKLIEDAITTWSSTVEKSGLKLVELPIAEASRIRDTNPFRSPYRIHLSVRPPQRQPQEQYFDVSSFDPQIATDKLVYQKDLMRKMGFVLDMEAADAFPSDIDVAYSWGKPDYQYHQFIHKSGVLLGQVTTDGDLLFLANRLYNNRVAISRETKYDRFDMSKDTYSRNNPTTAYLRSPAASPMTRPIASSPAPEQPQRLALNSHLHHSAETLLEKIIAFCKDDAAVEKCYKDYYEQMTKSRASPSPHITAAHGVDDARIPSLGLPPSLLGRDAMGSAMRAGDTGIPSRRIPSGEEDGRE